MERAIGDGGPAPKRDLTGTWAGPASGAAVPRGKTESPPPLTPLGKQSYERNKPLGKYSPGGTNDPHSRYCDPFGFPQNMIFIVFSLYVLSGLIGLAWRFSRAQRAKTMARRFGRRSTDVGHEDEQRTLLRKL